MVFGVARVKRLRILAQLSGLKLEAELQNGQASVTHREKVKGECVFGGAQLFTEQKQQLCHLCMVGTV